MKFLVSRCELVTITIEKSTVNNELNKEINKIKKVFHLKPLTIVILEFTFN